MGASGSIATSSVDDHVKKGSFTKDDIRQLAGSLFDEARFDRYANADGLVTVTDLKAAGLKCICEVLVGMQDPIQKPQFPFCVLSTEELLRLKRLPSHEEACDANLLHFATHTHERYASYELERIDGSDTRQEVTRQDLVFVSHRWFGIEHPDEKQGPDGDYVKLGHLKNLSESHPEIKYWWIDYTCSPTRASSKDARIRALHSVPHFIKSCANFVVLVDNTSPIEKYHWEGPLGWEQSARCRLERLAALVPLQLHWHGQLLKVRARCFVSHADDMREEPLPLGAYLAGGEGTVVDLSSRRGSASTIGSSSIVIGGASGNASVASRAGSHRSGAEKEDPDDHVIHLAGPDDPLVQIVRGIMTTAVESVEVFQVWTRIFVDDMVKYSVETTTVPVDGNSSSFSFSSSEASVSMTPRTERTEMTYTEIVEKFDPMDGKFDYGPPTKDDELGMKERDMVEDAVSAVRDALYALFPGTGEYAQRLRDAELAFADARDAGNLKELMMAVRSAVRDGLLEPRSITHGLGVGAKRNLSGDSAWPEKKYLPEGHWLENANKYDQPTYVAPGGPPPSEEWALEGRVNLLMEKEWRADSPEFYMREGKEKEQLNAWRESKSKLTLSIAETRGLQDVFLASSDDGRHVDLSALCFAYETLGLRKPGKPPIEEKRMKKVAKKAGVTDMNKITIDQFIAILSQRDAPDATEVPDVSRHLEEEAGIIPRWDASVRHHGVYKTHATHALPHSSHSGIPRREERQALDHPPLPTVEDDKSRLEKKTLLQIASFIMLPDNSLHTAPYSSWIVTRPVSQFRNVKVHPRTGAVLELHLGGAGLKTSLKELVKLLRHLKELKVLEVNNNWDLSGHLIELAPLKGLEVISVACTDVTGHHGLHQFVHMKKLKKLDVAGLNLSGFVPSAMWRRKDLELLREDTDLVPEFDEVTFQDMQYPFTVMRAEHLLELECFPTHEEYKPYLLTIAATYEEYNEWDFRDEGGGVHYAKRDQIAMVSHRWLSLEYPDDHDASMLKHLKRLLRHYPEIKFWWFDYFSVPQRDTTKPTFLPQLGTKEAMMAAAYSKPFYQKCCGWFFALCDEEHPNPRYHLEGPEGWKASPWCQLERLIDSAPLLVENGRHDVVKVLSYSAIVGHQSFVVQAGFKDNDDPGDLRMFPIEHVDSSPEPVVIPDGLPPVILVDAGDEDKEDAHASDSEEEEEAAAAAGGGGAGGNGKHDHDGHGKLSTLYHDMQPSALIKNLRECAMATYPGTEEYSVRAAEAHEKLMEVMVDGEVNHLTSSIKGLAKDELVDDVALKKGRAHLRDLLEGQGIQGEKRALLELKSFIMDGSATATWDARYPLSVYGRVKLHPDRGTVVGLDLAFVGFQGDLQDIAPLLAQLRDLEELDLSQNLCLAGDFEHLGALRNIKRIFTRFCPSLTGSEEALRKSLPKVQRCYLHATSSDLRPEHRKEEVCPNCRLFVRCADCKAKHIGLGHDNIPEHGSLLHLSVTWQQANDRRTWRYWNK